MARNGFAVSKLLLLCAYGCGQVTVEDPPSQLGVQNALGAAGNSGASPNTPTVPVGNRPGSNATSSSSPSSNSPSSNLPTGELPPVSVQPQPSGGTAGTNGGSAPVPQPPVAPPIAASGQIGDVLFADDFEDGDDAGWVADAADGDDRVGNWSVVVTEEGQAYAQLDTSSSDESWSVGGDINWTDVAFDVRFRFTDASSIEDAIVMIGVRFQDKDNYYYIEYGGDGDLAIRKRVDGSDPELSSVSLDRVAVAGEWIDVSFMARGDALEARVGGTLVGTTVVDADLASGGVALGVRENAAVEFDDVRVTVP